VHIIFVVIRIVTHFHVFFVALAGALSIFFHVLSTILLALLVLRACAALLGVLLKQEGH
jgi:hypothetical protein